MKRYLPGLVVAAIAAAGVFGSVYAQSVSNGGAVVPAQIQRLAGIFLNNRLLWDQQAPTIASGFGTAPSVTSNNGNATFRVNVGTGGTATTGVLAMPGNPASTTGWNCIVNDTSAPAGKAMITKVTSSTASTVSVAGYRDDGAAFAWNSAATLIFQCAAY